jgi:hypothetical protein
MTFEQHLKNEMKRLEDEENDRRKIGQSRQLLLPLRNRSPIWNLVREIHQASRSRIVE